MSVFVGTHVVCRLGNLVWEVIDLRNCPETGREYATMALHEMYANPNERESCPTEFLEDFYDVVSKEFVDAIKGGSLEVQ